jgi:aspartyl-tRNA(Asn)/glutamyl-tRNA(Gln) amidotransferase subunit B
MPEYVISVGMECHAELLTRSKMFCGCENAFGGEPNTRTCPVCLGLPGTLPVFNKQAVEHVVRTALALNCEISMKTIFHRKNYFYPDLPKGYQISQYGQTPIGINGWLEIERPDGSLKKIKITRVHLEEDTGKSIHIDGLGYSVMDYNRAGVPLMEIVTEFPPDIESGEEARLYAETLRYILLYLGVSDGKMEQGSLRAEPNPSVRPVGSDKFGTKTELKNLNSFRAVQLGVEFEARRQIAAIEAGETVFQATYGWDAERGESVMQRKKEAEQEYRYFPEPDLIPIEFEASYIETLRSSLPELPIAKKHRLMEQYGLPAADAAQLVLEREVAEFFEEAAKSADPKAVANWMLGDLSRLSNASGQALYATPITPVLLSGLANAVTKGTITGRIAKELIDDMFATGKPVETLIAEKGIEIVDASAVVGMVDRVIATNADAVARYKAGQEKLLGFFVGQVMKEAKGQARPDDVNRLVKEALDRQP